MVEELEEGLEHTESEIVLEKSIDKAKLIALLFLIAYTVIVVIFMIAYIFLFGFYFTGIFRLSQMIPVYVMFNVTCCTYIFIAAYGIWVIRHGTNMRHLLIVQYALIGGIFLNIMFPVTVLSSSKDCDPKATSQIAFYECYKDNHLIDEAPCHLLPEIKTAIVCMCLLIGVTLILQISMYSVREAMQGVNKFKNLEHKQHGDPRDDYPQAFDGIIPMFDFKRTPSSESLALSDISIESWDGIELTEPEVEIPEPLPEPELPVVDNSKIIVQRPKVKKPKPTPKPIAPIKNDDKKKRFKGPQYVPFKPISVKLPRRDRSNTPSRKNISLDPDSKSSKALQILKDIAPSKTNVSNTEYEIDDAKAINRQGPSKSAPSSKMVIKNSQVIHANSKTSKVKQTESKILGPSNNTNKQGANKSKAKSKTSNLNDKTPKK